MEKKKSYGGREKRGGCSCLHCFCGGLIVLGDWLRQAWCADGWVVWKALDRNKSFQGFKQLLHFFPDTALWWPAGQLVWAPSSRWKNRIQGEREIHVSFQHLSHRSKCSHCSYWDANQLGIFITQQWSLFHSHLGLFHSPSWYKIRGSWAWLALNCSVVWKYLLFFSVSTHSFGFAL